MLYIADETRVSVWKVDDRGKYSEIQMSSARKDKKSGEYINSSWGYVRFVGSAHEKAKDLVRGDRIALKGAAFSREPYMKDGEKLWPKNPSLVVFNFEWVEKQNVHNDESEMDQNPTIEDSDELPF